MPRYMTSVASPRRFSRINTRDEFGERVRRRREQERIEDRLVKNVEEMGRRLRPPMEVSSPVTSARGPSTGGGSIPGGPYVKSESIPEYQRRMPPEIGVSAPEGVLAESEVVRRPGRPGGGIMQTARYRELAPIPPVGAEVTDEQASAVQTGIERQEAARQRAFDVERETLRPGGSVVRTMGTRDRPGRLIRFDEIAPEYTAQRGASTLESGRIAEAARRRGAAIEEQEAQRMAAIEGQKELIREKVAATPQGLSPAAKAYATEKGKTKAAVERGAMIAYKGRTQDRKDFLAETKAQARELYDFRVEDKDLLTTLQSLEKGNVTAPKALNVAKQVMKYRDDPNPAIRDIANDYLNRLIALEWIKPETMQSKPEETRDEFAELRNKYLSPER